MTPARERTRAYRQRRKERAIETGLASITVDVPKGQIEVIRALAHQLCEEPPPILYGEAAGSLIGSDEAALDGVEANLRTEIEQHAKAIRVAHARLRAVEVERSVIQARAKAVMQKFPSSA